MANQRNADQVLVGFWTDKAFAAKIDKERGRRARSDFLREVLREYLQGKGFSVSDTESSAPDRLGKGGPAHKNYPPHQEEKSVMEDKALDAALKKQEILGAGQLAAKAGAVALGLKPKAASTSGKKGGPARPAPRASSAPQSPPKPVPTSHGS